MNVIDLIMQDHREVERLFDELRAHPEKRQGLVPVLTTLLVAHSRAEEAEVYPVAAEAGGADDVEHSQEEHLHADQLLEELAATDPESAAFDGALQKLVDAVTHHVEEEESTVLPGLRTRLSEERLGELGDAFARARKERLGDQPGDMTKHDLDQQAQNLGLQGMSGKSKQQLESELAEHADS